MDNFGVRLHHRKSDFTIQQIQLKFVNRLSFTRDQLTRNKRNGLAFTCGFVSKGTHANFAGIARVREITILFYGNES
jgi:hypothetical protein